MFVGVNTGALAPVHAPSRRTGSRTGPAERAERARRKLLAAIGDPTSRRRSTRSPGAVGRGAPAVSRSVDALVRAGLVERTQDPDNRRRLALRLTASGRDELTDLPTAVRPRDRSSNALAHSELRAIERAIEILERAT